MKNHNKELSILKGIGIFLVVLGHTNSSLVRYIYFFHVPLLYFASGYFLRGNFKTIKEWILYFKDKFLKLYLPFLKFVVSMVLLHNIFYNMNLVGDYYSIKTIGLNMLKALFFKNSEVLLGAIWFIPSLFLAFSTFMFLNLIFKKYSDVSSFVLLVFALLCINGNSYIEKIIEITFVSQFFLQLGYCFKKNENKINISTLGALLSIMIFIFIGSKIDRIDIAGREYSRIYLFLPITISGIYLSIYFSKKMNALKYIGEIFDFIGKRSYFIMLFHIIGFKILSYIYLKISGLDMSRLIEFPIIIESNFPYLYTAFGIAIPIGIEQIFIIIKNKEIKFLEKKIFIKK